MIVTHSSSSLQLWVKWLSQSWGQEWRQRFVLILIWIEIMEPLMEYFRWFVPQFRVKVRGQELQSPHVLLLFRVWSGQPQSPCLWRVILWGQEEASEGAQCSIQTEHLTGSGISVMHRWLLGPPEACRETPTPCATWWGWEGVEAH